MLRHTLLYPLFSCCIAASAVVSLCAQTADDPVRLKPIVVFEETQRLQHIRKQVVSELEAQEKRKGEVTEAARRVAEAVRTEDAEQQLMHLMQAVQFIGEVADRSSVDKLQTVELLDRIQAALRRQMEGDADEIVTGLRGTEEKARAVLADQTEVQRRLKYLRVKAIESSKRIPPPRRFSDANGIAMVLIGSGAKAVYISEMPISRGEIGLFIDDSGAGETQAQEGSGGPGHAAAAASRDMAEQFCQWLTARNRARFRLPDLAELRALTGQPDVALWTSSEWKGPSATEKNTRLRFGVMMYCVWDPGGVLGAEEVFGEVPFAAYPQLGFRVVTSLSTGERDRWNRLREKLKQR